MQLCWTSPRLFINLIEAPKRGIRRKRTRHLLATLWLQSCINYELATMHDNGLKKKNTPKKWRLREKPFNRIKENDRPFRFILFMVIYYIDLQRDHLLLANNRNFTFMSPRHDSRVNDRSDRVFGKKHRGNSVTRFM